MIKVYVSLTQLEELQFLVERRLNDLIRKYGTGSNVSEITILRELKKELEHAGT